MTPLDRRTFLLTALAGSTAACGLMPKSPWDKELQAYTVRDPLAGYFDLARRRAFMRSTKNPVLVKLRNRILRAPSCDEVMAIPVQDKVIRLPSFYEENPAWRVAVKPFSAMEDAVSKLAAANLVADDRSHAHCLVTLLTTWAERNALAKFNYTPKIQQGWFQVESTLFAIALALAAVRPDIQDRAGELAFIDGWLTRVATKHYGISGQPYGTCCNNHYYRRSLYAAMIGVMTGNDALFRGGVGAIYSALSDATPEGALPLEMKRGPLAAHYQNYALMYLAMIAEIVERQGYPMWSLTIGGRTLHALSDQNNRIIANPDYVTGFSGVSEVSLRYRDDNQYFAWFEMYLAKFPNPQMEAWIAKRRPLYNRSLGGHLTAYFYSGR